MTSGSFLPHEGSPPTKRDLKSWWKSFKLPKHHETPAHNSNPTPGIFGVDLKTSIRYANVAISLVDEDNCSYVYGYVPIVVAKCGVYLKEKATGVEGIFRLSGSEKRIKELKTIFDSPDRYGKGLVWDGYTVHDAANVLRRYLNDLPEPVVPLNMYERFREPLKGITMNPPTPEHPNHTLANADPNEVINKYHALILQLQPLNRQLLLYLLDLLAVFSAKADENRMNSQNLAAIFQPGMLSHPSHDMLPEEYRLNQAVIIFLIENQDHFLIGMGPEADEADARTVLDVQHKSVAKRINIVSANQLLPYSGLARSGSNASAGAESVRRDGKLRRNQSVSSRHSRTDSGARTPRTPTLITMPSTGGGLARSNTVPSKKSGVPGGRRPRESPRETASSLGVINDEGNGASYGTPQTAHAVVIRPKPAAIRIGDRPDSRAHDSSSMTDSSAPTPTNGAQSQERLLEPGTPSRMQLRSPTSLGSPERRQPNKLRKRQVPGINPSAHSSATSLRSANASPMYEVANPMESAQFGPPLQPLQSSGTQDSRASSRQGPVSVNVQPSTPQAGQQSPMKMPPAQPGVMSPRFRPQSPVFNPPNSNGGRLLNSKKSPPTSLHSSFNEGSDIDQVDQSSQHSAVTPTTPSTVTSDQQEKAKKRSWRSSKNMQGIIAPLASPFMALGLNSSADRSSSSIGSDVNRASKTTNNDAASPASNSRSTNGSGTGATTPVSHDVSMEERLASIKNKYRDVKDAMDQRIRAWSPPPGLTHFGIDSQVSPAGSASNPSRGPSCDLPRDKNGTTSLPGSISKGQMAKPRPGLPGRIDSDHVDNRPDLPPRTSHESHKVPVGPRKPVPISTANSIINTPASCSPIATTPVDIRHEVQEGISVGGESVTADVAPVTAVAVATEETPASDAKVDNQKTEEVPSKVEDIVAATPEVIPVQDVQVPSIKPDVSVSPDSHVEASAPAVEAPVSEDKPVVPTAETAPSDNSTPDATISSSADPSK